MKKLLLLALVGFLLLGCESKKGKTTITYTNPEYWSLKYNIKEKKYLAIITKAALALEDLASKVAQK